MVLVIVAQDRKNPGGSLNCFELRKIRPVAPLPDTPLPRQFYLQQQLLKKSWVLSKRLNIKMPVLHSGSQQKRPVVRITQKLSIRPSSPKTLSPQRQLSSHNNDDEPYEIIEALERKRKQLDDLIAKYTADRNEEYRRFETGLRSKKGLSTLNLSQTGDKSDQIGDQDSHVLRVDAPQRRDEATRKSVLETTFVRDRQSEAALITSSTQSSVDGLEKEFSGLFTPSYLPLLDSRNYRPDAPRRTSSAPDLFSEVGDNSSVRQAEAVVTKRPSPSLSSTPTSSPKLPRTHSSPSVESQQPASALKHTRKPSRAKKVSFNLDNKILVPADTVERNLSSSSATVTCLSTSPATQSAVSPPLPLKSSDSSIAATQSVELTLPDSLQTSSTEPRLQSAVPKIMGPRRDFSGSGYDNSKQLSSIYEEDDLVFGMDDDDDDNSDSKPLAPATSAMSSGYRTSSSAHSGPASDPSALPSHTAASSSAQSGPAGGPPGLHSQSANHSASSQVSPPMAMRGSHNRRTSSTYGRLSPIVSLSRTIMSPSNPNFAAFIKDDPTFSSFVGGIRGGSGVDPSDRSSYGYPPSLGESYMERNFRRGSDPTAASSTGAAGSGRETDVGGERKETDGEHGVDERNHVED